MADINSIALAIETLKDRVDVIRKENLSLDVSRRIGTVYESISRDALSFRHWMALWHVWDHHLGTTPKALWGTSDGTDTQRMLEEIAKTIRMLNISFANIERDKPSQAGWRKLLRVPKAREELQYDLEEDLEEQTTQLSTIILNLSNYSNIIFDTLKPARQEGAEIPALDKIVKSTIDARTASLALYDLIVESSHCQYSFAIDSFDSGVDPWSLDELDGRLLPQPQYHIFMQVSHESRIFQRLDLDIIPRTWANAVETSYTVQTIFSPDKASRAGHQIDTIQVPSKGSVPPSQLRIPSEAGLEYENLLDRLLAPTKLKIFSSTLEDKIGLACRLTECALYLLGTPLFCLVGSRSLQSMMIRGGPGERPRFALPILGLKYEYMSSGHLRTLTEHTQLFRLGMLLVEIALDETDFSFQVKDDTKELDMVHVLLDVGDTMGWDYSNVVAYYLQNRERQDNFAPQKKYDNPHFGRWETFLKRFLRDYYSHVYSRLKELRESGMVGRMPQPKRPSGYYQASQH